MITLYVLGSGSRGNCIALESDGAALLIDAGFSAREIERRAQAAGFELERVVGIAITHEHVDHTRGAPRLARQLGVPVLTAPGTWNRIAPAMEQATHRPLGVYARVEVGPFAVEACATSHDAAEPLAIVVRDAWGVSLGIAYDLGRPTVALRYLLRELTGIVLEANHDEVQLRTSDYPAVVQRRIAGSSGHLSNRAAAQLLAELCHPGLATVVLAHLSDACNTAAEARAAVARALRRTGFKGVLHVADQDQPLRPILVSPRQAVQLELGV